MNIIASKLERKRHDPVRLANSNIEESSVENFSRSAPAFRINDLHGQTWIIFDQSDEVRFSGTLHDCEAWLDWDENNNQKKGWLSYFSDLVSAMK